MISPITIRKSTSAIVFACTVLTTSALAQDREELEARRQVLLNKIALAEQLLEKSQLAQQSRTQEMSEINAQLRLRRNAIENTKKEIIALDADINQNRQTIKRLNEEVGQLEKRQGKQLREHYIGMRSDSRFAFLMSAASLNQAYERWRFTRAVTDERKRVYRQLLNQRDSIAVYVQQLEELRRDKQSLSESIVSQEKELRAQLALSEKTLAELRTRATSIREEIDRNRRESARLAEEIESIISAEIDRTATGESALPNAPAMAALSGKFNQNKGKLPWPVERGIVTGKFGDQPHPVLPKILIKNNGIDITAPPGESVRVLYDGTVVGRTSIPGFNNMIIVQHGQYYTVYSRLEKVYVDKGDRVTTGQVVGKLQNKKGSNPSLHLEIWQNKTQLNPEQWIIGY